MPRAVELIPALLVRVVVLSNDPAPGALVITLEP